MLPDSTRSLNTGIEVRTACRQRDFTGPTSGLARGFVQANLVILPVDFADDFRAFCQKNAQACPLLAESEPGQVTLPDLAADLDLRTDLPRYRIWRHGRLDAEPTNLNAVWQNDFVSFALGCSFTFEAALHAAGIPLRHWELGCNVPMYSTNRACVPVGPFHGELVVSMRPLTPARAIEAVLISARFPEAHGPPIHWGQPRSLGIDDLNTPDFGDPVPVHADEEPVFWACGVTPQNALIHAALPLAMTHSPGCMLVTDQPLPAHEV